MLCSYTVMHFMFSIMLTQLMCMDWIIVHGLDYYAWTVSIYVERWSFFKFISAELSFSLSTNIKYVPISF